MADSKSPLLDRLFVLLRSIGNVLSLLSVSVILITVLSLPWMLGGVVPLARLVLLVGTVIAATLSLLANVARGTLPKALPAVMIPLTALALLGVFQLRPADESLAANMHHAVSPASLPENMPDLAHTLIPAETRSTIATLLALALLACVAFDHLRTSRTLMAASLLILCNGIAIASVGMTHLFGEKQFWLNQTWSLGEAKALVTTFATFVNPNNAAGWLCLCVAVAAGWVNWHLKPGQTSPSLGRGRLRISFWGRLWQRTVEFLADLTVWQIITLTGTAVLAAGVAATQSRGGIVALVVAIVVTAVCRSSIRHLPIVLLALAIMGGAAYGVLRWLELDSGVVSEMETLKDLDTAAGSRPAHWLDSLQAVRDFPVFGTGLGSYRQATPAYSRHHNGVSFRNADNHYVDMMIEGGVVGLLLFVAIGVSGLMTGFATWQQSKTKTTSRTVNAPRLSRRVLAGIGTTIVLATFSQAVAAFLDYGVGLPAASSLLVLVIAAGAGFLIEGAVRPGLRESGTFGVGAVVVVPLQIGLVLAAASQIPDQVAAARIDEAIVAGHHILIPPVQANRLDKLSTLRTTVEKRLKDRPDDIDGLRMITRLADAEFRWRILQMGQGEALRDNPKFSRLWKNTTIQTLVSQLAQIERENPLNARRLRQQMLTVLNEVNLKGPLSDLQKRYPMMPRLAEERADLAVLEDDIALLEQQVAAGLFADPSNGGTLFKLGSLAVRSGKPEIAERVWLRCLELTDEFRSLIVLESLFHWPEAEALELFGPRTYVSCVLAAQTCPDPTLRTELWKSSDEFWTTTEMPVDAETALVRVTHLLTMNREEDAGKWLETALTIHPDHVELRRHYARLLEKQQHFVDALKEWYRVQYLEPADTEAGTAITRIRSLKSPTPEDNAAAQK